MRVTVLVHFYVPHRNAGSETMLHCMLRALRVAGHEVSVVTTDMPEAPFLYEQDGVRVMSSNRAAAIPAVAASRPDVIVTHHQNSILACKESRRLRVPLVLLVHNDFTQTRRLLSVNPDLVVFNTEWIRDACRSIPVARSIVVHPPVVAADHAVMPGSHVTLVNLNEDKGANILYELAERLPCVDFLGVVGGHGKQVIRDMPNVEIIGHAPDMKRVWSRTRILLMPSLYESYGMCAVEAAASGIPTIANPTPGLQESLGGAGIFVDREDMDGWVEQIVRLDEQTEWDEASQAALRRSAELDPSRDLADWVRAVEALEGVVPMMATQRRGWIVGG